MTMREALLGSVATMRAGIGFLPVSACSSPSALAALLWGA